MLMVFADFVSVERAAAIDATGCTWKQITTTDDIERLAPMGGWRAAHVHLPERGSQSSNAVCEALSSRSIRVLATMNVSWMDTATTDRSVMADFVLPDASADELRLRLKRLLGTEDNALSLAYPPLRLDPTTYQAWVDTRVLDLTYMEYELLRWFVTNPDRVYSREELLREVWKYEYYGGARTVDVHVRRLRSKIGREHAHLIQTVRSVGYLFGNARYEDF